MRPTQNIMMQLHLDIIFKIPYPLITMRTTINIDDDMFAAAQALARAKSISIGRALSDLARRGLTATSRIAAPQDACSFPMFTVPPGSPAITLEDVKKLEDEV